VPCRVSVTEQRTLSHPLQQATLLRLSYNRHLTRRIHIDETLPNTSYSHRDAIVHPFNRIDDPIFDHIPDPILQNLPPTFPNTGKLIIGKLSEFIGIDGKLLYGYFTTVSEVFLELIAILRPFQRCFGS
jgi:hypothetical protein